MEAVPQEKKTSDHRLAVVPHELPTRVVSEPPPAIGDCSALSPAGGPDLLELFWRTMILKQRKSPSKLCGHIPRNKARKHTHAQYIYIYICRPIIHATLICVPSLGFLGFAGLWALMCHLSCTCVIMQLASHGVTLCL